MADHSQTQYVACPECDQLYQWKALPEEGKASCGRCGAELYRHVTDSLNRSLAWYLTAFVFLLMANCLPFLSMRAVGLEQENLILSGALALAHYGMPELGLLVFLTSTGFPLLSIVGMIYVLVPALFGWSFPGVEACYRLVHRLHPWSLVGVFLLGTLIAFVKLQDIAAVIPGPGLFAFGGMLLAYTAANSAFNAVEFWQTRSAGLTSFSAPASCSTRSAPNPHHLCHVCHLVQDQGAGQCKRCFSPLHYRLTNSLERTSALTLAAAMVFIPANLYPIMTVSKLGQGHPDTILSGVISLMKGGMISLALVVLFASIIVPLVKLILLTFLIYTVKTGVRWRPKDRTLLYRVTEVVGAWSMVDIFLVGLLSGLVSLGFFASVVPDVGATFFAATVVLTMLAAHSFDPRLIWDKQDQRDE